MRRRRKKEDEMQRMKTGKEKEERRNECEMCSNKVKRCDLTQPSLYVLPPCTQAS